MSERDTAPPDDILEQEALGDIGLLKNPGFRWLVIAHAVGNLGFWGYFGALIAEATFKFHVCSNPEFLKQGAAAMDAQRWVKSNVTRLSGELQAASTRAEFGQRLLSGVVPLLGGGIAGFYVFDEALEQLRLAYGKQPDAEIAALQPERDRHLALLSEMKVLRERLRTVPTPGLRYESRLLGLLPEEAVIFASAPNYGQALAEAYRLFQERLQESAVLRDWWAQADPARHGGPDLATVIERVRGFSGFLGDEIVLAAVDTGGPRHIVPLVLAEVRKPGLREFLEGELARLPLEGHRHPVTIVDEGEVPAPAAREGDIFILLRPGLMAVSVSGADLPRLAALLDGQAASGLDRTPFGARIAEAYGDGVGLLFAADLQRISARMAAAQPNERRDQALHSAGIDGLRYLVFERKQVGEAARTEAVLAFDGAPRGIASWLAAPAPMGALDFVSPSAQVAAAFVAKSPALIFDDLVSISMGAPGARSAELEALESKLDLHIREDLAETLGGEFALALDGPLLPTPAWKVVVEVADPARLQSSLEVLVRRASEEAARSGRPPLALESDDANGQTYHVIRGAGLPTSLHYAFAEGYAVAAPSRALVMRALQARSSGDSLGRSSSFRALFTPDRDVNVSGLVYENVGPLVRALLDAPGAGALSADQRRAVDALSRDARPAILCAYGEPSALRVAGLGGVFDLDTADLALPMLVERVMGKTLAGRTSPAGTP
jgi:hypothetical protein